MTSVWRYAVSRILFAAVIFFATTVITYVFAVGSGNQFWNVAAELARQNYRLTPEQLLQMQNYYHLNQPVYEGYLLWLGAIFSGDLGPSVSGPPVAAVISPWIVPTLILQIPATLASMALGLVIGIFSANRLRTKTDTTLSVLSAAVVAIPAFWLSLVAIVAFSLKSHLLPSYGMASGYPPYWWGNPSFDVLAHWIMPFLVLVVVTTPLYARVVRASASETLAEDYVRALRVHGLKERSILYRHVMRRCLGPVLAVLAISFGLSMAVSPGIEVAFSWPGLGRGLITAALNFDQPVVMAVVLLITLVTLTANALADVAYSRVDPRGT